MRKEDEIDAIVMCDTELKSEVFKVVRANSDKTAKQVGALIREHLPGIDPERVLKAIKELST